MVSLFCRNHTGVNLKILLKKQSLAKQIQTRLIKGNNTLSFVSALLLLFFITGDQSYQSQERRDMISEIEMKALITGLHTGLYKVDKKVLRAMSKISRRHFVQGNHSHYAYKNIALPIEGAAHKIPEPFLAAMMIHLLSINPNDRVLEIGYNSGYETAIISKLAKSVYSIYQKQPKWKDREENTKYYQSFRNISHKESSGIHGWTNNGLYDSILVKQAIRNVPETLLEQLKPGGRLVAPIQDKFQEQRITVFTKSLNGEIHQQKTLFVKTTLLLPGIEI